MYHQPAVPFLHESACRFQAVSYTHLTLPRVRDFHGVSATGFDGRGNYTLGLKEQLIFPEIEYDKVDKARGMDITIVTTAETDEEGRYMLKLMGMPFEK